MPSIDQIVAGEITPELLTEIAVREAAILVRSVVHGYVEDIVRDMIYAHRGEIEASVRGLLSTPKQECSNGDVETVRD
jgi:hypothetical protein